MAESNATQVILTDDGLKIIKAQDTANEAVGNVNDINSDNKLTPSEKLKLKQEYDKDVELYNIDIEQLKSVDLPTAELETAMSNLTDFVTPLFKEMNIASTVDRDTLDSVFTAFATADKNASQAFVNMVQQVADGAKKAGDDAKEAGEKAQEAGEAAKQAADQAQTDATQAKADAATAQQKAQSSIDQLNVHLPDIDEALSTANLVKQDVTKLSDTTEQYHNEYTTGIQNLVKTIDDITVGGTNLIKNSKFDDKMNGWRNWCPQGMGTSTVEINLTGGGNWPRQAIYLAKIVNTEADKNNQFGIVQDSVPVEPGTEYVLQLFNDGSDPITLQHGNGTGDPFIAQVVSDHKAVWKFKTPANTYTTNIYIGFDSGQSGAALISLTKLEKGNKATDWSPAPADLATSTEIDQINNAIKLKANSSDVTSQINVAIQGVQTDVTNKVSGLNTKISQTDSAWRASVSTLGTTNMVYNGGFAHGIDGWNTTNGKWIWSNQAQDQVQGNNAIQANFTGLTTDTWNNAASRPFLVCPGQKMSIGAIVTPWVLDSDPKKGFGINIEFYASKDGTGTRNNYHPDQWIYTTGRQQLKAENITVPEGVNSAVVRLFIQRNGGANFTCVQANMTPTLPQFIDGFTTATDVTASINNINLKVSNADGTSSQLNINNNTILLDANKIIFNGNTSIQNGTIGTAKIANAAINTAQIADGAINNAKIANAAIDDAKISNLNGNKIIAGSIAANKIDVNDLIANGINTKTLTSVNLNTSTLTTPQLNLGLNGTFTEDFDYTQPASMFLPKKNIGTLTFNHGVLQSKGRMQTYTGGQWGGMNDNYTFQAGIDNAQWTEVGPGYIKQDLFKQNDADVGQRTYMDPTGYYYTSRNGIASYLGNVLQTSQVQAPSVLAKYIGATDGRSLLQIVSNGDHYGLQVGPYAGNEAVLSDFIFDSTTSGAPNVNITTNGHLVRSTSASKYKYNIKNPDIETALGDRLLNVHMATWNDKHAVDMYAEQLSTGDEREKTSIDKYYGLIAEQLRDAGLDMFISYGKNHEIEGIQYDRAWIPLLSVIRRLNDKVNDYELRISKLEGKINE
ncbi:autotransporter outer membrane beta-barrel domain-containing protein [Pediococcus pentosaceus]